MIANVDFNKSQFRVYNKMHISKRRNAPLMLSSVHGSLYVLFMTLFLVWGEPFPAINLT